MKKKVIIDSLKRLILSLEKDKASDGKDCFEVVIEMKDGETNATYHWRD